MIRPISAALLLIGCFARLAAADRVLLLETAQNAAQARIDLIRDADELYLEYFSFADDQTSLELLSLLDEAARAGKKVHLLLDGMGETFHYHPWRALRQIFLGGPGEGGEIPPPLLRTLADNGVQIRLFHPLGGSRLDRVPLRTHDKLFIAVKHTPQGEQVSVILGSRNIRDAYFGRGPAPHRETDLYVAGKAAENALGYYRELWASPRVAPAASPRLENEAIESARTSLERARAALERNPYLDLSAERRGPRLGRGLDLAGAPEAAQASFTHDEINFRRGSHRAILDLLASARHSIVIANPYVVLSPVIQEAISQAIARGVTVKVLTNSFRSSDQQEVQWAYHARIPELARLGIELWEYDRPNLLHKKVIVVDDRRSYIGTFNLDPRSLRQQLEVGIVVTDERLAVQLRREIEKDLSFARPIARGGEVLAPLACIGLFRRLKGWLLGKQL